MKKTVMFLAIAVLLAGISLVSAETGGEAFRKSGELPRGAQMGPRQERGPIDQLNLTEAQNTQIKSIRDEMEAKIREIRSAGEKEISAVLTPEQNTKLEQLRQEAQAKMKERMEKEKAAREAGNPVVK
ncbi:MAG: hypothetical protein NTY10_01305 [Candidatus Omnitrophica bacterium]|nr:hypothetical protein [Candidatus Omnitrophota bacterium]